MLATIITDAFRKDEAIEIAAALEDLCSPKDNYGWASAGVYSFWDIRTREIYYIGVTVDLSIRFRQHTGLQFCDPNGCKIQQITEHFSKNEFLGYSIFVQSCLNQPPTAKIAKIFRRVSEETEKGYRDLARSQKEEIINAEGFLIEAYKRRHKTRPEWNRIDGAKKENSYMQELKHLLMIQNCIATERGINKAESSVFERIDSIVDEYAKLFLDCFTVINTGSFLARSRLRTLSANPELEGYEELILHPARMLMRGCGFNFVDALAKVKRWAVTTENLALVIKYEQMLQDEYLQKKPMFS